MFYTIVFYQILGLSLLAWGGMVTLLCFLFTAYIGWNVHHATGRFTIRWHIAMVTISLTLAFIHGIVAFLAFYNWK